MAGTAFNSARFTSLKIPLLPSKSPSMSRHVVLSSQKGQSYLPSSPSSFQAGMVENGDFHEPSPKIAKLSGEAISCLAFLKVKKLSPNAILPSRASSLSAGYDLSSAAEVKVPARGKALVPTDLSIAIPEDTYARISPRSGLTWKHSIDVGAGVIDADYRGPVSIILFNHSDLDFAVKPGDRIAQLIIQKIITPEVVELADLDSTVRGCGGFGSTGLCVRNEKTVPSDIIAI